MKTWISKWIIFVSAAHSITAVIFFGPLYLTFLQNGLVNTVNSEKAGLAVWFLLFGLLLFIAGQLLAVIESSPSAVIPKSIGVTLLLLTLLGVTLMPVSGFWLVFPAVIAILLKKSKSEIFID